MPDTRFFKKPKPRSLSEIVKISGAELRTANDPDLKLSDVAPIHLAEADELSFLDNKKYLDAFVKSKAGACFIHPDHIEKAPKNMALLVSKEPYKAYALAAQAFYPVPSWDKSYIAVNAFIHPTAKIGSQCIIDHNVYIGRNVEIEDHCWIRPNTVIGLGSVIGAHTIIGSNSSLSHCLIGQGCQFLPGVRIGQDGFGFAIDPTGHVPVPQLGRVIIGDRVYIGANTTIDRGAGPDTEIGDGTMIDNLVQIAHNVKIGKFCIIVSQVGISGSSVIEDYAVLAGQVGVAGHITIGRGARVAAQSGLMRDVPAGTEVMGSPAIPLREQFKQIVTLSNLAKKKKAKADYE